jgi:hypothetical protein
MFLIGAEMDKKYKILIITYYFPPINAIASHRPYSWAKYWSRMGHDITVLTTKKEPKSNDLNLDCSFFKVIEVENVIWGKLKEKLKGLKDKEGENIKENYKNNENIKYKVKKFFIYIIKLLLKRGLFGSIRMPNQNDLIINKSSSYIINDKYDIVVSTAGPYNVHLIAYKYKKKYPDTFWVADYRDLWTQNHIFKGLFPFTIIEEYLENKVNHKADLITTVSKPFADQIKNKYKIDNVEVIENGFDPDDFKNLPPEPYWKDDKVRLVYTGTIYAGKQDPSPLFEAVNQINNSIYKDLLNKLEVIFVGGAKGDFDFLVKKYNVSNWVKHEGFKPGEDSLRMQRDAHALIFLEFESKNVDGILTGKLFEYLYSGTKILGIGVTDNSAPGKIIKESGCGINFGKDVEKIKNYLIELLKTGKKDTVNTNNEILEKFSRKNLAEKLMDIIEKYMLKKVN